MSQVFLRRLYGSSTGLLAHRRPTHRPGWPSGLLRWPWATSGAAFFALAGDRGVPTLWCFAMRITRGPDPLPLCGACATLLSPLPDGPNARGCMPASSPLLHLLLLRLLNSRGDPRQRGPDYHDNPALIPQKGSLPDPLCTKKAAQICATFFDRSCVH